MNAPRLAYHCGTCDHELTLTCETCQQRDHDEQCEAHALSVLDDRTEQAVYRAQVAGIGDLETRLNIDVRLGCEADEDGGTYHWARTDILGQTVQGSSPVSFAEAVVSLRHVIAVELRAVADETEGNEP